MNAYVILYIQGSRFVVGAYPISFGGNNDLSCSGTTTYEFSFKNNFAFAQRWLYTAAAGFFFHSKMFIKGKLVRFGFKFWRSTSEHGYL